MRIDSVHIENFKGFADRTFEFPRSPEPPETSGSFHLLIGENGSGKTSALDAIAVALGAWHELVGYGKRDFSPTELRISASGSNGRVSFIEQGPARVAVRVIVPFMNFPHPILLTRELKTADGTTKLTVGEVDWTILRTMVGVAQDNSPEARLPLLAYYGTGRLWRETPPAAPDTDRSKLSRLAAYRNCLDSRARATELNQWLLEHDWETYQKGEADPAYDLVKSAILRCLPGAIAMRFAPLRKEATIEFAGGNEQPFSNLSDGQQNIMALVGDLAVKAVRLNYAQFGAQVFEATPGVVLIDELDMHLHPRWQQVIVEHLRTTFPCVQFIATSHSPFIVQSLREGELLPLDGQPIPVVGNLGIEEIAKGLMGVPHPEAGTRYVAMKEAAKDYLLGLEELPLTAEEKLEAYLDRLAEGIGPFADNPAYQAFLELKKEGKLGQRKMGKSSTP